MSDNLKNNKEFQEYRERVHGRDEERANRQVPGKAMRSIFGIFMVIVYVGMGILFMSDWFARVWGFEGTGAWNVARYVIGIVLIIYGLWRAYRQFKGIDNQV